MQIYLVGGAVRDELLGLEVKDRDWVVVGSSPEEMLQKGFTPVGRDFPVFLHPQTHEEYALARTERKSAPGYHGFTFHASPEVTLLEDLARRDLTINAMAKSSSGELIDPFGGAQDLNNQIFRHVSPAFEEDPVRVLRLARFAARLPEFSITTETLQLARKMARQGEIGALVPERVWAEVAKGLMQPKPARLFEVLMACEAFNMLWPQLSYLEDHSEAKGSFLKSLNEAAKNQSTLELRYGLCFYPYATSALSPMDAQNLCESLKAPSDCKELALLILQLASLLKSASRLSLQETLHGIEALDGFRRPKRLLDGLAACSIALNTEKNEMAQEHLRVFSKAFDCTKALDTKALSAKALSLGLKGPEVGQYIQKARVLELEKISGE